MSAARFLDTVAVWDARWTDYPAADCGPLPAGITPTEARLQELLLAGGHPHPLAEAARIVGQDRAASGTDRPVPAAQWSGGTVRPSPHGSVTKQINSTRPRHAETDYPTTSQPAPTRPTMERAPGALPTPTGGPNPPSGISRFTGGGLA